MDGWIREYQLLSYSCNISCVKIHNLKDVKFSFKQYNVIVISIFKCLVPHFCYELLIYNELIMNVPICNGFTVRNRLFSDVIIM